MTPERSPHYRSSIHPVGPSDQDHERQQSRDRVNSATCGPHGALRFKEMESAPRRLGKAGAASSRRREEFPLTDAAGRGTATSRSGQKLGKGRPHRPVGDTPGDALLPFDLHLLAPRPHRDDREGRRSRGDRDRHGGRRDTASGVQGVNPKARCRRSTDDGSSSTSRRPSSAISRRSTEAAPSPTIPGRAARRHAREALATPAHAARRARSSSRKPFPKERWAENAWPTAKKEGSRNTSPHRDRR